MAAAKIKPFQAMSVNGRNVLEFGPRYSRRAYDDTTVIQCFHRTLGGGVSVLFERNDFATFTRWLAEPGEGRWEFPGLQTTVSFEKGDLRYAESHQDPLDVPGGLLVRIWWNGSGRTASALLDARGRAALLDWAADKEANGWEGWKSGRKAESDG